MNDHNCSDESSDSDISDPPPPNLLKLLEPINEIKNYIWNMTDSNDCFHGQWHYFSSLEHYKSYIIDHYNGWSLERLERFVNQNLKRRKKIEDRVLV